MHFFVCKLAAVLCLLTPASALADDNILDAPWKDNYGADQEQSGSAEPHICALVGCLSAFRINVAPDAEWPDGQYEYRLNVDGQEAVCRGSLPGKLCERGDFGKGDADRAPAIVCEGAFRELRFDTAGCVLHRRMHGFDHLYVASGAKHVRLRLFRNDKEIAAGDWEPVYKESFPNGPSCEPRCSTAPAVTLEVPSFPAASQPYPGPRL